MVVGEGQVQEMEGGGAAAEPAAADFDFAREMVALQPTLLRLARGLTKSPDRAGDLLQDTFARMLRYQDRFTPGTNLKAWACMMMRNQFYTECRRNWRQQDCFDDAVRTLATPDRPDTQYDLKELEAALSFIPTEMSEAIRAVTIDGLSYEEAAYELRVDTGTVKSRVSRGRDMLKLWFSGG